MIQTGTKLRVADNSGAKNIECIKVLGSTGIRTAHLGYKIVAAVAEALPNSRVKKGDVVKAVVVRTSAGHQRNDGSSIRFDENAAVILDNQGEPAASRVFGPVPRELRECGYLKIASLAPEVV